MSINNSISTNIWNLIAAILPKMSSIAQTGKTLTYSTGIVRFIRVVIISGEKKLVKAGYMLH